MYFIHIYMSYIFIFTYNKLIRRKKTSILKSISAIAFI